MASSDIEEARRSMSRAEFEQEYMASFTQFEGQIFSFNSDTCVAEYDPLAYDRVEYFAGIDPGFKDPTAMVVVAYVPALDTFWIVDEYQQAGNVTAWHAQQFQQLIDRWGVDAIFIDSAAAQFASDLAYMYDIPTIKAKKDVLPGIAYVQTLVEQSRLRV